MGRCVQSFSIPDAVAPLVRSANIGESRPDAAKKFMDVVMAGPQDHLVKSANMTLREKRGDSGIFDVEVETEHSDTGMFVSHVVTKAEVEVSSRTGRVVRFRVSSTTATTPLDPSKPARGDSTYSRSFDIR